MGIQFTGLASGIDTQSIISDLMKVERMRVEDVEKDKTMVAWKKEAWEEMNAKLFSFYKTELFDFKSSGTYSQKKLSSSNEAVVTVNTSPGAIRGTHTIDVTKMASGSFLTGTELTTDLNDEEITSETTAEDLFGISSGGSGSMSFSINGEDAQEVTFLGTDTISDMIDKIQDLELDINVSFDENFNRLFLSTTDTGTGKDIVLTGDEAVLDGLGFESDNRDATDGADAEFTYNGASFTSDSNDVSINGLSLDIVGEGESTIGVTQDTDAIYDKVKEFILKYNEIITEIQEKVGAESARGYEPLTNDEKQAMTEDDVKLWEERIKTSILRRDDTLTSIINTMRNTLTLSSDVDTADFTYSNISELGIVTGGYQENGLLHIKGDEDDSQFSLEDNTLREAIENDPDGVLELLSAVGESLYDNFNERMQSTSLSSALTFYNNKQLDSEIVSFEDDIFDLEDRLSVIEERYYKQFTAMEQAIQQANSTGQWLAQQLGGM